MGCDIKGLRAEVSPLSPGVSLIVLKVDDDGRWAQVGPTVVGPALPPLIVPPRDNDRS